MATTELGSSQWLNGKMHYQDTEGNKRRYQRCEQWRCLCGAIMHLRFARGPLFYYSCENGATWTRRWDAGRIAFDVTVQL